jgi:hypothetical protein
LEEDTLGWVSSNCTIVLTSSAHIPLFAAILIIDAGVLFLIQGQAETLANKAGEVLTQEEVASISRGAIWSVCISLAVTMVSTTAITLLHESLDPPGTMKISSRYLRLAPRGLFVLIVVCMPISPHIGPALAVGMSALMISLLTIWEWVAGLDKGGKYIEPRRGGLVPIQELRSVRLGEKTMVV